MADITVQVTFDQNAQPQFTFAPDPARMNAAGKVILNRNGSTTWTFTGAFVKNDTIGQFTVSVNPGGQVVQITDAFRQMGTYGYRVTVTQNGRSFTSPDPEIVNEPSQGS